MQIKDVKIEDVVAGRNWRLSAEGDLAPDMVDWEIEECSVFQPADTVVYSGLEVLGDGEVRPFLLIREIGTYEWWGDMCEFVDGKWRELGEADGESAECYVADPLAEDPSFLGEDCHENQRAGFARARDRFCATPRPGEAKHPI